jgi:hypothetical protein
MGGQVNINTSISTHAVVEGVVLESSLELLRLIFVIDFRHLVSFQVVKPGLEANDSLDC